MITIVAIMGLGDNAQGDCHGLRPFLERMQGAYGIRFVIFAHSQADLRREISALNPAGLIGFSNGGDEAINADELLFRVGAEIDFICLLDAKPKWSQQGRFSFRKLANWFAKYQYPLPLAARDYRAFHGDFGCPFQGHINSTQLAVNDRGGKMGHTDFPGDSRCLAWIESRIARAVESER